MHSSSRVAGAVQYSPRPPVSHYHRPARRSYRQISAACRRRPRRMHAKLPRKGRERSKSPGTRRPMASKREIQRPASLASLQTPALARRVAFFHLQAIDMPLPSITPRPQVFRFGAVAYSCFVVSRCQTDVRAYVHMCEPDRAAENRCSSVLLDRLDDDPPSMPSSLHLFRSIDSSCLAHDGGTHTGTTASSAALLFRASRKRRRVRAYY